MINRKGSASWTYLGTDEGNAWYVGLSERPQRPYRKQVRVDAILDIDAQGRLAGIELLDVPGRPPAGPRTGERHPLRRVKPRRLTGSGKDSPKR